MTPFERIEEFIYGNNTKEDDKKVQSLKNIILFYNYSENNFSKIIKKHLGDALKRYLKYIYLDNDFSSDNKSNMEDNSQYKNKAINAIIDSIPEISNTNKFQDIFNTKTKELEKINKKQINNFLESQYEIIARINDFIFYWIIFNHTIKIFNSFCLSVLKGEYLYNDHLSDSKIKPLQNKINEFLEQRSMILVFNIEDALDPEKDYLEDVKKLCSLYYIFNRNIDKAIDENAKAVLKTLNTNTTYDEFVQYTIGLNSFDHNISNNILLLNMSQIFPYLFHLILDMTYIDHNFAVGENEMDSLLNLKKTLKKVIEYLQKLTDNLLIANEGNKTKHYLNKDDLFDIKNLIKTLQIIDIKNSYLIYKIYISDKSNKLKNYTYILEGDVTTFKQEKLGEKLPIDYLNRENLINNFCDINENDLLKESIIYNKLLSERFVWNRDESFKDYERYFLKAIGNKNEFERIKIYFEEINKAYASQKKNISTIKHADITSYNRKIAYHAKNQFTKYGKYIKELNLLVNKNNVQEYIRRLELLIKTDPTIYSCSFIIKHIDLILNELEKVCNNSLDIDNDWGFRLRSLAESLLILYQRLIKSINDGDYCINFASLYQDAFYEFTWNKNLLEDIYENKYLVSIKRVNLYNNEEENNLKTDILDDFFKKEENENTITCFIASTWMQPVGKIALKENYERLQNKKTELVARFYSIYFQKQEQRNREREENFQTLKDKFQIEVDETKHNMVQTLGIFATFLALATISVGGFAKASSFASFFKTIGCITFCLGIFVLMLRFIVGTKFINKTTYYINLVVFLILLLILLCVILAL